MNSMKRIGMGRLDDEKRAAAFVGLVLVALFLLVDTAHARLTRVEMAAHDYDPTQSAGLFVGIRNFEHLGEIKYAVDDAIDLAYLFTLELDLLVAENATLILGGEPESRESRAYRDELIAAGATVLSSPTSKSEIYHHLNQRRAQTDRLGMFLVFFATHGVSSNDDDYLMASFSSEADLADMGMRVATLLGHVQGATTPRRLVLIDACRERLKPTRGSGDDPMSPRFARAIREIRGLVAISATVAGGVAYDDDKKQNGVFSAAILRGLRGAAEANTDAHITVRTLADYVDNEVRKWIRIHHPEDDKSTGIGVTSGEWRAVNLPLAVHPERSAEKYRARVENARRILGEILKQGGEIIEGDLFKSIMDDLENGSPCPAHRELLAKIEYLGEPLSIDKPKLAIEIREARQYRLVGFFQEEYRALLQLPSCKGDAQPLRPSTPPTEVAQRPTSPHSTQQPELVPNPAPPTQQQPTPSPPTPPPLRPTLPRVPDGPSLDFSIDIDKIGESLTFWRQQDGAAELFIWKDSGEIRLGRLDGNFQTVRFSPRARYLAGVREKQIYIYDLRKAAANRDIEPHLLYSGGLHPEWSRDGSMLAWIAIDSENRYELVSTRVNGVTRYRQKTLFVTERPPHSLAWESEGGKNLALSVRAGARYKILIIPAMGGQASDLLSAEVAKESFSIFPQWSDSDISMYFTSSHEGSWAVYQSILQQGSKARYPRRLLLGEDFRESSVMSVSDSRRLALLTFEGTILVYREGDGPPMIVGEGRDPKWVKRE